MTATLFEFHRLEDGRHLGFALLCAEARYLSVRDDDPPRDRLERCHPMPHIWREIMHEVAMGIAPGPMPAASTIARQITAGERRGLIVQYVTARDFDFEAFVGPKLDAFLLEQPRRVLA